MKIIIPVNVDNTVGHAWGRAHFVAVATVVDDVITDWAVDEVRWDELHDAAGEGSHHARIVRYLMEHEVEAVVVDHMGQGMVTTITKMGLPIFTTASDDAKASVLAAAQAASA